MQPAAGEVPTQAAPSAADAARFMALALQSARRAGLAGDAPIGACLVREGEVLTVAANGVVSELDVTAHAEMRVLREACRRLRTLDLAGCELFVTVEPCPMCVAACHYARVARVTWAASLDDLHAITGGELRGATPPASIALTGGVLREQAVALLREWNGGRRPA
jgi:tRNA(Arg) A34 adenosine deaminase TadA